MPTITPQTHPSLCFVLRTIDHNVGKTNRIGNTYVIPDEFDVDRMELELEKLQISALERIAIDETTAHWRFLYNPITGKTTEHSRFWYNPITDAHNPILEEIHYMLNLYFEDWPDWRTISDSETITLTLSMSLEEAKEIARKHEHTTLVYQMAYKVLKAYDEQQLAYYVEQMFRAQQRQEVARKVFEAYRKRVLNPRKATMQGTREHIVCIVNGAAGIYGPQRALEKFSLDDFCGTIDNQDWKIVCFEGPSHEDYWECWQNILTDARLILNPKTLRYSIDDPNIEFQLYGGESGDIFLVPSNVDFEEHPD